MTPSIDPHTPPLAIASIPTSVQPEDDRFRCEVVAAGTSVLLRFESTS